MPEVIICDYRLRDGETGFDGLATIKGVLNKPDIPVIILTGDTTPELIQRCQRENYLLLYKPAKLLRSIKHCRKSALYA